MVFQALGALILVGMLGTFIVVQKTSFILTLGGFLLILAGALGGVDTGEERRLHE